jgi:hypothetical protein
MQSGRVGWIAAEGPQYTQHVITTHHRAPVEERRTSECIVALRLGRKHNAHHQNGGCAELKKA